jgi:hypothetical protein
MQEPQDHPHRNAHFVLIVMAKVTNLWKKRENCTLDHGTV